MRFLKPPPDRFGCPDVHDVDEGWSDVMLGEGEGDRSVRMKYDINGGGDE